MTELPKGWASASLTDAIAHDGLFTDGDWVESKDQDPSGSVRLIQLADIADSRFVDKSARFLTREKAAELNCTFLKKGDLLVARMPDPLGRCCIFPLEGEEKFVTVVDVCAIRVGSADIDDRYLMRVINSPAVRSQITALQSGSTRKRISRKNLATVSLPIPPFNEQRRIVARIEAMFDEIDHGVQNLKKAKATLGLYRQSLLKAAFEGRLTADWRAQNPDKLEDPETLLARIQKEREARYKAALDHWQKKLADWRAGGENGKKPAKPRREPIPDAPMTEQRSRMKGIPPEWQWVQVGTFGFVTKLAGFEYTKHVTYREDGDLPVIKAENAGRSGFKVTDFSKVASSEVAMLTRSQLSGGELLMVFVGAGTGNVATVPSDRRYFLGPNIGMIRLETPDVLTAFVEHYLRSPLGTAMKLASVKAVAQPSLSMGAIRQIPVALPCPAEQAEITRILDERLSAADALEAEIDEGLTRAEALRQSILKQAFSGKLVPQDPNDEPASILLERIKAEKAKAPKAKRRRKATA